MLGTRTHLQISRSKTLRRHVAGDMKVAWFKDPDGNILNIIIR
jgi:hypothetical protein